MCMQSTIAVRVKGIIHKCLEKLISSRTVLDVNKFSIVYVCMHIAQQNERKKKYEIMIIIIFNIVESQGRVGKMERMRR